LPGSAIIYEKAAFAFGEPDGAVRSSAEQDIGDAVLVDFHILVQPIDFVMVGIDLVLELSFQLLPDALCLCFVLLQVGLGGLVGGFEERGQLVDGGDEIDAEVDVVD
jgi:hypothetical protein